MRNFQRAAILIALAFGLFLCARQSSLAFLPRPPSLTLPVSTPLLWTDIDGRGYGPLQLKANALTVFVFFSTECPVSNAYMGRLRELEKTYFAQRVRFFLVNAHPLDTPQKIRRYADQRNLSMPLVKDTGGALAERLHAEVTPEALILDREGRVRYRGRIDDNKEAALVRKRDLAAALETLLAGQAVATPWPPAQGCYIVRGKPAARPAGISVTYARDIAPILNKRCVACHRPGEVAPFSLLTYGEAHVWARQIKDVTQRRIMPPWKAAPGYGDFHDASTLTGQERIALARWADAGAPAGDLKMAPRATVFSAEWPLGKPDLILRPKAPYHLAAEGRDVYRCFVLPAEVKDNVYIDFSQIKPGNRSIVHHIIVYADPTGKARQWSGTDPEAGFDNPHAGAGPPVSGAYPVAGWAPGNRPFPSPAGVALPVPKGATLIMEVHYHRSGRAEVDRSAVGLTFARSEIRKYWSGGAVIQPGLALEPGKRAIPVSAHMTLGEDVTLYAIGPHMHQLGKEMHVWAITPQQKRIELIWLKDWDFNWQNGYRYQKPIPLPKGTRIEMTALFDNSESNPRNPHRPPQMITWGEQTTDEMCIAFLVYTRDAQRLSLRPPRWDQAIMALPPDPTIRTSAAVTP